MTVAVETWRRDLRDRLAIHGSQLTSSHPIRLEVLAPAPVQRGVLNPTAMGIPTLEDIPVSSQLSAGHPLAPFITREKPLTSSALLALLRSPHIDLSVSGYHSGAIAAALENTSHNDDLRAYSANEWGRDAAIIACALNRAGYAGKARLIFQRMWHFLGSPEQRGNITGLHLSANPRAQFLEGIGIPAIKYSIRNGDLVPCSHDWGMQQLDAIGASLFGPFRIANQQARDTLDGIFIPEAKRMDLRALDPVPNARESILPAAFKMLNRIEAWDTEDYGPWEDFRARSRATSVGIILAACQEAEIFFERNGWGYLPVEYHNRQDPAAFREEFMHLLERCRAVVNKRIPETGLATECDRRPIDSSLCLLLYPFTPHLSAEQEATLLRTLYCNMGEAGFRRWEIDRLTNLPDGFVGMDYFRNTDPSAYGEWGNNACPGYKPAEWSLFDPLIAGYYFRRYIESHGRDEQAFLYGDRHLKRTLSFITKSDHELWIEGKARTFTIRAGCLPEAKAYDSRLNVWRDNHNDLLMARAALGLAFERALEASRLHDRQRAMGFCTGF